MTEKQKEGFKKKQSSIKWGFFDLETTQNYLDANGVRQWLPEHYVTTVVLIKVVVQRRMHPFSLFRFALFVPTKTSVLRAQRVVHG